MTVSGKWTGWAKLLLAVAAACGPVAALAGGADDGAISGINAVTSARLALYARPAADSKVKEVPKESVKLPLAVSDADEEERFLKVKIDGENYWLRSAQVLVVRSVSVGCLAQANAPVDAASIRGANAGCKK